MASITLSSPEVQDLRGLAAHAAEVLGVPARYLGERAARQPIPPDPDRPASGEEPS